MKQVSIFISAVVFAVLQLFALSVFAQSPWTQKKGESYLKLSAWGVNFDQHYTDVGLIDPNVTTGIYNVFAYAQYGLSDRITGVVNAAVLSRYVLNNVASGTTGEVITPGDALTGIGDLDLGVTYALNKPGSSWPVSASLILGVPLGESAGGSQGNLQTGDGEFNQYFRVDAGKGFSFGKATQGYASANLGINNRSKGFSEELRFGFESGVGFRSGKYWLIGRLIGVESFKNGETAASITSTSIFANNTEFVSIGLEANIFLSKTLGISTGFATAVRGEIIAAAPSYTVGVFLDLSK